MEVTDFTEQNLTEILTRIHTASSNGARFICFPEISLVSDETRLQDITREVAQIKQAAKDNDINVIFGTYIQDEKGHIRNQIWIVNRQGGVVYRYSKRNPFLTEKSFLKAGRQNKVVTVDEMPFAVIDCWDYAFPEHIRGLAKRGAKVIFCPSYLLSHPRTREVLDRVPQVRAFDTMAYFIMVDSYAPETFKRTRICHPLHEIASVVNSPATIYADIDLTEIDELRETYHNLA
jgi:(R)-amidase